MNTCGPFREDLEAFALRALSPEEETMVSLHLDECADCSEIVRAYQMAVDHMALAMPVYRAPSRLKSRVMGGAVSRGRLGIVSGVRPGWLGAVSGVAAAAVLIFAIGAVAWAMRLSNQVDSLRTDNQNLAAISELDSSQREALLRLQGDLNFARSETRRLATDLEEQATLIQVALDPDLVPTELHGTSLADSANCNYVWSTKQLVGALTCKQVPTTSFGITYELWVIKGSTLLAVGSFTPTADGTAQILVKYPTEVDGPVTDMWVTLERLQSPPPSEPRGEVILTRIPEQQAVR